MVPQTSFVFPHKVPRLRIAIEKANRNAALGMTDFSVVSGSGLD
jgi:hypothetical protein